MILFTTTRAYEIAAHLTFDDLEHFCNTEAIITADSRSAMAHFHFSTGSRVTTTENLKKFLLNARTILIQSLNQRIRHLNLTTLIHTRWEWLSKPRSVPLPQVPHPAALAELMPTYISQDGLIFQGTHRTFSRTDDALTADIFIGVVYEFFVGFGHFAVFVSVEKERLPELILPSAGRVQYKSPINAQQGLLNNLPNLPLNPHPKIPNLILCFTLRSFQNIQRRIILTPIILIIRRIIIRLLIILHFLVHNPNPNPLLRKLLRVLVLFCHLVLLVVHSVGLFLWSESIIYKILDQNLSIYRLKSQKGLHVSYMSYMYIFIQNQSS